MAEKIINKGGRPQVEQPKSCRITGTFTEQELGLIKTKAHALGITRSEYVSMMANKGKIVDTFSSSQKDLIKKLIGLNNNINQIAKLAHTSGINSMVLQADEILREINTLIKQGR